MYIKTLQMSNNELLYDELINEELNLMKLEMILDYEYDCDFYESEDRRPTKDLILQSKKCISELTTDMPEISNCDKINICTEQLCELYNEYKVFDTDVDLYEHFGYDDTYNGFKAIQLEKNILEKQIQWLKSIIKEFVNKN